MIFKNQQARQGEREDLDDEKEEEREKKKEERERGKTSQGHALWGGVAEVNPCWHLSLPLYY